MPGLDQTELEMWRAIQCATIRLADDGDFERCVLKPGHAHSHWYFSDELKPGTDDDYAVPGDGATEET